MLTTGPPATSGKHRRPHRRTGALLAALAVVVVVAVMATVTVADRVRGGESEAPLGAQQDASTSPDEPQPTATSDGTPAPSNTSAPSPPSLQATLGATTTEPMEAVELSGRLEGGQAGTAVQVQLLGRNGGWITYPLRPVLDESGAFTTYVEVGRPGRHRLRVVEPVSDATSEPLSLQVR